MNRTAGGTALRDRAVAALAGALPQSFWTSQPGAPDPAPALTGTLTADLAVVGGGFSGLWTALLARERDPSAEIVLLEAATAGWAASGRNGGFCSASLTHGIGNGLSRFPTEMPLLEKLGAQNLAEIGETVAARGIDCGFAPVGELTIATQPWQLNDLHEEAEAARRLGHDVTELYAAGVRRELDLPAFLGGSWYRDTCAMVDPARLARGLRQACLDAGVRLFENTRVDAIRDDAHLALTAPYGRLRTRQAALATGAYKPLLRRIGSFFVPVYDYVLVTEPLSAAQRASLGWRNRQGPPMRATSSTTSGSPTTTGSCGAVTTRSTSTAAGSARPTTSGRRRSCAWPSSSSLRSHSWTRLRSSTPGAARSTRAAASSPTTGPPAAAGSATRPGTPGWASEPAGSPRT